MFESLKKMFLKEVGGQRVESPLEGENVIVDKQIAYVEAQIKTRIVGCLLGLAVGDAKGMPAESKSVEFSDYVANTFDFIDGYLPAGSYTDDTHHATILMESLLDCGKFDPNDFMSKMKFIDTKRGIGPTTIKAISRYLMGIPVSETGLDSASNGAAMRVAPLAVLYRFNKKQLKEMVIKSTITTHNNKTAIGGALSVAFTIAYVLNHFNEEFDRSKFLVELQDFIKDISPDLFKAISGEIALDERYGCYVMESVPYAIRAFMDSPRDYQKTIQLAIRGGGDADTIAAIAGAISGAFNGEKAIPQKWVEKLENTEKGRDYIIKLANNLSKVSANKKR